MRPRLTGASRKSETGLPAKKLHARLRHAEGPRKRRSKNERRRKSGFAGRKKNGKKRSGFNANRSSVFRVRQRNWKKD